MLCSGLLKPDTRSPCAVSEHEKKKKQKTGLSAISYVAMYSDILHILIVSFSQRKKNFTNVKKENKVQYEGQQI